MWAMVYFRELPVPLKELKPEFLEIFFKFANIFTEKGIQASYVKQLGEAESRPTADMMRRLHYTEEDIAKMDLRDGSE